MCYQELHYPIVFICVRLRQSHLEINAQCLFVVLSSLHLRQHHLDKKDPPAWLGYTPPFTPIVTLIIVIVGNGCIVIPFLFFFLGVFRHFFVFMLSFTPVIFLFRFLWEFNFALLLFILTPLLCIWLFWVGIGGCASAHIVLPFIFRVYFLIFPTAVVNVQWF